MGDNSQLSLNHKLAALKEKSSNQNNENKYGYNSSTNSPSTDKILLEPYNYISQIPGKQFRTRLTQAFNHWLNIPDTLLHNISEITQMLHNASLLIDDIEDNSKLRRGIPVAHSMFGVPITLNSANYVYFLGLKKVLDLGHPDAITVFTEQMLELHRGQGMDIYWRDAVHCPTEEEYKAMVIRKTGGLFGMAIRLMQLFSSNQSDFKNLLELLGLYFQIRDDYCNMKDKSYEKSKTYCEDLSEGKFSFPLIHAIQTNPDDNQVLNIIRQRTDDLDLKKYCVDLLEQRGTFDYVKTVLVDYEEKIFKEIESFGGNSNLVALLNDFKIDQR
ncbi:geranylgeranyl pyrophosphate synthase-like [Octopus vulgaris]|nr:geranylgeranyl pyrophosphate synthase isoform X3 [Octopus sinensis]XP_036368442.1 geranylgeranyl pyrophosphate synthase isoform X3 [Octopus sinensis]CAI9739331.1 geranylgeranyl pyrophosphate synthase-like [Octopus vulgaris]